MELNKSLKAILYSLVSKRYIGGKHTPEEKLIKSKTKWIGKKDKKIFEKQYKQMINEGFILRLKKRTGKGSGYHVSLNPRKLKELIDML